MKRDTHSKKTELMNCTDPPMISGQEQDRSLLYVFKCAVYFAETNETERDAEKLKWWNWKDTRSNI